MDSNSRIASWSSRGPEVDLIAPGVEIPSTWKSGGYKTISGTSMASPHVAGTAALVLAVAPDIYDLDGNGFWSPEEVKNKLQGTAEWLANLTAIEQGAGLVELKITDEG